MINREKNPEGNGFLFENSFQMALVHIKHIYYHSPTLTIVNIENLPQPSLPLSPVQDLRILLNTAFQAAATNQLEMVRALTPTC